MLLVAFGPCKLQWLFRHCRSILDRPSRGTNSTCSKLGRRCWHNADKEPWRDVLSKTSQLRRSNRLELARRWHADFVCWLTRKPLWINNSDVDSRPVASDVQAQSDRGHLKCVASLRPVRELLRLCEQGHLDEAVTALFCMDRLGITPPVTLYSSVLRACARRKALIQSRAVHASLATHGLETTRFLGEFMVSTLVKCGGFEDALQLFHRLPYRTVFSWTAVISGYSAIGQGREALRVYYCMQTEGLDPDKFTFRSLLKACTSMRDLEEGRRIHSDASKYSPV